MVGCLGLVDDMRFDCFSTAVEYTDVVDAFCGLVGRVGGLIARKDGEMLCHHLEQFRVRGVVPVANKKERLLPLLGFFHDERDRCQALRLVKVEMGAGNHIIFQFHH